ncbi:hypothetical protein Gotri_006305 [Gossypium trilobum]|uniref:DUF4283 domain-containing protein n=1 Tax=Gossypium trilobum TaxID=34281 RepID=A0A7J9EZG5_9ROSI|nr:hypothetical protein [Gossypium trilobum]
MKDVEFLFIDFWVHVHDLPPRIASESLAKNLGNVMGKFLDSDVSS